jgi:hypothetical protein
MLFSFLFENYMLDTVLFLSRTEKIEKYSTLFFLPGFRNCIFQHLPPVFIYDVYNIKYH